MATYKISVKDRSGNAIANAKVIPTDANYKPLSSDFAFTVEGLNSLQSFVPAQPQFYASVEAPGYQATKTILKEGNNAVTLYKEGFVGTIDKYKMWIIILVLLVAVYFAWKYKVWTKLKL